MVGGGAIGRGFEVSGTWEGLGGEGQTNLSNAMDTLFVASLKLWVWSVVVSCIRQRKKEKGKRRTRKQNTVTSGRSTAIDTSQTIPTADSCETCWTGWVDCYSMADIV